MGLGHSRNLKFPGVRAATYATNYCCGNVCPCGYQRQCTVSREAKVDLFLEHQPAGRVYCDVVECECRDFPRDKKNRRYYFERGQGSN